MQLKTKTKKRTVKKNKVKLAVVYNKHNQDNPAVKIY